MASVTFKNLRKAYGDNLVVKQIDMEVPDGEFVVLLGPSGCGKSTVLRMVAGLETVTDGQIMIGDRVVNDARPGDRDIAFVFQNYALYPHMTVRQNMAFCLENQKLSKDEIGRRIEEATRVVDLKGLLERLPGQLSGGQRQRVAIGRSIVRQAKVLLMDEPLSNLDAKLRGKMRAEISRIQDDLGITTLYVTHDQIEAMTMGDRIVIMHDGIVQQVGAPMEVYRDPNNRFVAGFIGSPGMNFLDVRVEERAGALEVQADGVELALSPAQAHRLDSYKGGQVILGFRPQHIAASNAEDATFSGTVQGVEPYGPETYISMTIGEILATGRLSPDDHPVKGKPFHLAIPPEKVYFFDPTTQATIR